jgi:Na+-driven multidrug efflux pump
VFHWGIAGAAAATLIAQVCSAIYCLHQMRKMPLLKISVKHMCLDVKRAWRMIRLGMPVAFQNVVIAIGGLVIQSAVNGFGVTLIAGFTATNKFIGVLEIAATSFGYAMVTYAGQNLGAGNIGRIRSGMRVGILLSLLTSAVIAAVMIAFGKNILLLFISGNPDEVTATLDVAYYYLVLVSAFLPVLYVLHVTRSVIQGMGNTFLPMISGIAEFVMRVGTVWILPAVIGFVGAFYAEVFAWVGADLILIPSYFIVIKKWERILCENRI